MALRLLLPLLLSPGTASVQQAPEPVEAFGIASAFVTMTALSSEEAGALDKGVQVVRTRQCPLDREAQNAILAGLRHTKPVAGSQGREEDLVPIRSRYVITFQLRAGGRIVMAFSRSKESPYLSSLWFDGVPLEPDSADAQMLSDTISQAGCDISIPVEAAK